MHFPFFSHGRRAVGASPPPGTGLQVCPACHGRFVVPVEWEEADATRWWIRLRCGACEHMREVTVADDVAQRLDRDLHADTAELERMVAALEREAMERDLETLLGALRHDLLDPSAFGA